MVVVTGIGSVAARRALLAVLFGLAGLAGCSPRSGQADSAGHEPGKAPLEARFEALEVPSRDPDIHFVPTPQAAVEKMLEMAQLRPGELVYDLGCGDGRIVVTAARLYKARGIGFDIDPVRVAESRENVNKHGVEDLVRIVHADIFTLDLSDADVVTLYLLPDLNVRLMPQLRKLKPGARIVSYDFDMRGARAAEVFVGTFGQDYEQTLYKWIVPWVEEPNGEWLRDPDIHFVPTPEAAVEKMLEMADIQPGELVYDLGCGDGRIVVAAARLFGARGVGVDIDPERVDEAHKNVRKHGVEKLVRIVHADIFEYDFSDADVVTLYLLPELNVQLMPKLRKLKPGARIISYEFDMAGARPQRTLRGKFGESYEQSIYKWVVPWVEEDSPEIAGGLRRPDIHFVPTPQGAVEKMLELAELKPGQVLYDLGCGDGRIVVTAARLYKVKAVGVDIDPRRVIESTQNVRTNKVEDLVRIEHGDIFERDLSEADVVTLYLLPELNVKLLPQLRKLKPGARIISYEFDMHGAEPNEVITGKFGEDYDQTIFKWVVPWREESIGPKLREPDIYYVPTPQSAVEKMLELAELKPGEVLYDLGCGDGRIVVTAARLYGARATGIDIDSERVRESRLNVLKNKVEHLARIEHADIFEFDFSDADVITLYLLPELNVKLMPKLRNLKPGARIISYEFDMHGAKPAQVVTGKFGQTYEQTLYKWIVPWQEQGETEDVGGR